MKVLHLTAGDLWNGAAMGALNLHTGLLSLGFQSSLLTNGTAIVAPDGVMSTQSKPLLDAAGSIAKHVDSFFLTRYRKKSTHFFSTGLTGYPIEQWKPYRKADIIHLHWTPGLVSFQQLKRINKPVVWTLRDMWPFTGGCHYSEECVGYQRSCGSCPQLGSRSHHDLTTRLQKQKAESLPKKLTPVAISRWLAARANESAVFQGLGIRYIPNGIDTEVFHPIQQTVARNAVGLPLDRKIVLFGAQDPTDSHKGLGQLLACLEDLRGSGCLFVSFGRKSLRSYLPPEIEYAWLGFIKNKALLRSVYCAANVFLAPYLYEAFGKTVAEAQACGVPVVCFDNSGPGDIVVDGETGIIADSKEPHSLAQAVQTLLLMNEGESERMSRSARQRARTHFDSKEVALEYSDLYRELLEQGSSSRTHSG